MTELDDDAPARVLAGRFRLESVLGRGGMATVWSAHDTRLDRMVAVKILHQDLSAENVQRIEREARAAARIADPRVVTVLDLDHGADGAPFLVFEALSGRTLADEIRDVGALRPARVERLADDLFGAVRAAHECGVLHRDIKPSNVLLDGDGYRITDFGIASVDDDTATRGDLIGTLGYVAPERFEGAPATPQSDVFAAAAVLYEAVTGHQPFRAATAAETIQRLRDGQYEPLPSATPPHVRDVIVTGLDPDPAGRDALVPTAAVNAPTEALAPGPAPDPTERLDHTARLAAPVEPGPTPDPGPDLQKRFDEFRTRPRVADTARWARRPQTLFIAVGVLLLLLVLFAATRDRGGSAGDTPTSSDPATALDQQLDRIEELG